MDERISAYHEAGHAVVAFELGKWDYMDEVSMTLGGDVLGSVTFSEDGKRSKALAIAAARGKAALLEASVGDLAAHLGQELADKEIDSWDDRWFDGVFRYWTIAGDRWVEVCLAGHVAEEVFCGISADAYFSGQQNDLETDEGQALDLLARLTDVGQAFYLAEQLGRCTEASQAVDCSSYIDLRWQAVSQLLGGKYRAAVEALVERLLDGQIITGGEILKIVGKETQA